MFCRFTFANTFILFAEASVERLIRLLKTVVTINGIGNEIRKYSYVYFIKSFDGTIFWKIISFEYIVLKAYTLTLSCFLMIHHIFSCS